MEMSGFVDGETECLSLDGWKHQADLSPGDAVYAVDAAGALVESTVESISTAGEPSAWRVSELRNDSGLSFVGTDDQRFLIQNYHSEGKKWGKLRTIRNADLLLGHFFLRVPLSDATKRVAKYTDDEVALFAWVASEGHLFAHRGSKEKRGVGIVQSQSHNPHYVAEIDALLNRLGGHYNRKTAVKKERGDTMVCWQLRKPLWSKVHPALPGKMVRPALVADLTIPQMRLFLHVFTQGDGHFPKPGGGGNTICQKDIATIDSLQAMAFLSGQTSTAHHRIGRHNFGVLYLAKFSVRAYRKEMVRTNTFCAELWQPETVHGTWLARRNGRTFIASN